VTYVLLAGYSTAKPPEATEELPESHPAAPVSPLDTMTVIPSALACCKTPSKAAVVALGISQPVEKLMLRI
jgi:hypothetical protein